MDWRLTPSNGRVAHEDLRGKVEAEKFTVGTPGQVSNAVTDLCASPGGPRARQLLMGDPVTTLEVAGAWRFLRSDKDGYCGYVAAQDVGDAAISTHRVSAPATHIYAEADIKSQDRTRLSLGSRLCITGEVGSFAECVNGYIPSVHLRRLTEPEPDPISVAMRFLGTPYLWGGNTRDGIDCSGLVQAALAACDVGCPADSDLQEADLGSDLGPRDPLKPGDMLFWKGHVAMLAEAEVLIHANAHHMAVVLEPLNEAIHRIARQGGGPVTRRARP